MLCRKSAISKLGMVPAQSALTTDLRRLLSACKVGLKRVHERDTARMESRVKIEINERAREEV